MMKNASAGLGRLAATSAIALAVVMFGGTGQAADLFATPPEATPAYEPPTAVDTKRWQGLYGGIFAGWGAGNADVIFNTKNEDGHFWDLSHDIDGWFGGARGGFDIQSGMWVFGVFGDIALADINGNRTNPQDSSNFIGVGSAEDGPPVNFKTQIDKIATLQARGGPVLGQRTLIYAHGGAAIADVTLSGSGGPANDFNSQSDWRAGVVGGFGIEHMLFNNVSVFAEYSYMNFLQSDLFLIADGSDYKGAVNNQGRDLHSIIFGVNVRMP